MNKHILFCFAMIATARAASAQDRLVSIGALGGVPFLDQSRGGDESRKYIVGPSVEFRLPARFAIEVDALYRRIGTTFGYNLSPNAIYILPPDANMEFFPLTTSYSNRQRGNYWQFPVLGKYYFRPRTAAWQPFVGTGWALRTVAFHSDINATTLDANGMYGTNSAHVHFRSDTGVGAVVAAGVRFRAGKFALTPQVRYTYWGSTAQFDLRRNEACVFLGVTF